MNFQIEMKVERTFTESSIFYSACRLGKVTIVKEMFCRRWSFIKGGIMNNKKYIHKILEYARTKPHKSVGKTNCVH